MKKQHMKSLKLNKKSISNFNTIEVKGGRPPKTVFRCNEETMEQGCTVAISNQPIDCVYTLVLCYYTELC
ncbi:hypothetical protein [Kordia sp.]|uniref:hypothetical protein n=1 Tax=Kordia sp. TaxID=1965332 RepID=UPI003D6C5279